jgi:hypothetical protein
MNQTHTSIFGELGIQGQHLDGEGNLVDYALAGRLLLRPQFQIAWSVVVSIAVLVVHVFMFFERTFESLRHQYAMLVGFFTVSIMQPSISRRMQVAVFVNRSTTSTFPPAFLRAKFLLFVVARVSAVFSSAQVTFLDFAAQLALKRRWRFMVHVRQLHEWPTTVKEIV